MCFAAFCFLACSPTAPEEPPGAPEASTPAQEPSPLPAARPEAPPVKPAEPRREPTPEDPVEPAAPPPSGPRPKFVVSDTPYDLEMKGLPALSVTKGRVAVQEYFDTTSDAVYHAVNFVEVSNSKENETVVLWEINDKGSEVQPPDDTLGKTLWRRSRNLEARFTAEGYVSMLPIAVDGDPAETEIKSPLRVRRAGKKGQFKIQNTKTKQSLYKGQLPMETYFCGMESMKSYERVPDIMAAWVDRDERYVALQYGFEYASCMCQNLVKYRVISLSEKE